MEDTDDIELEIDAEDATEDFPVAKAGHDPAAEAFARLEGEMALMRRAVQHLAAERADIVIPDYGATLAEMTKRLGAVSGRIAAIADHPAMQLTPDSLGRRIEAVAESARRTDYDRINQAQSDLRQATQEMRAVSAHARTAADQRHRLFQAVGGGVLAGILLWSFLPGLIARSAPTNWHWRERMATRMLGERLPWDAGARLMQAYSPQAWQALNQVAEVERINREALRKCRRAAARTGTSVQCKIQIR